MWKAEISRIRKYCDNNGSIVPSKFCFEDLMYRRATQKKRLDKLVRNCDKCAELNVQGFSEAVCGYGNIMSPIMFIGQSAGTPCMGIQIPFSGGSGYLIDAALITVGLRRNRIFMTNVVHCHTPKNRQSKPTEINNCFSYLTEEIRIVKPKLIIAMGKDAQVWCKRHIEKSVIKVIAVKHPAFIMRYGWKGMKTWILTVAQEIAKCLNDKTCGTF